MLPTVKLCTHVSLTRGGNALYAAIPIRSIRSLVLRKNGKKSIKKFFNKVEIFNKMEPFFIQSEKISNFQGLKS